MSKEPTESRGDEERTVFLKGSEQMDSKPKDQIRFTDSFQPLSLESQKVQTKSRCRCCSWKCCAISTAAVVCVIAAILLGGYLWFRHKIEEASKGGASTVDNELWAQRLENSTGGVSAGRESIPGKYRLVSYDLGYEDYLKAFGTPSFIVSLVIGAWETQEWSGPDENGYIAVLTQTGLSEKEIKFRLGEEFQDEWGRGKGIMHTVCRQPEQNIVKCESSERKRNWSLTSENRFSRGGMVNVKRFLSKNVTATKYFQREGVDFEDVITGGDNEENLVQVEQQQDSQSPFASQGIESDPFGGDGPGWDLSTDDW